ncbi:MAG TPA: pyruvate kinase, partial [Terriglobia bacterium]|nr:pyruvate kinase [Terriglobia bacterium]
MPSGSGLASPPNAALTSALARRLEGIREAMRRFAADQMGQIGETHESSRRSVPNLLHYVALRQHDLRELQEQLAMLGLSSLGRAESHVMANVEAVLRALAALDGRAPAAPEAPVLEYTEGKELLARHTYDLLGAKPARRNVRIMVTLPGEAA